VEPFVTLTGVALAPIGLSAILPSIRAAVLAPIHAPILLGRTAVVLASVRAGVRATAILAAIRATILARIRAAISLPLLGRRQVLEQHLVVVAGQLVRRVQRERAAVGLERLARVARHRVDVAEVVRGLLAQVRPVVGLGHLLEGLLGLVVAAQLHQRVAAVELHRGIVRPLLLRLLEGGERLLVAPGLEGLTPLLHQGVLLLQQPHGSRPGRQQQPHGEQHQHSPAHAHDSPAHDGLRRADGISNMPSISSTSPGTANTWKRSP